MALPIPAEEVAVGDYSPEYGTVKSVRKQNRDYVEITFANGKVITPEKTYELIMDQGGRF